MRHIFELFCEELRDCSPETLKEFLDWITVCPFAITTHPLFNVGVQGVKELSPSVKMAYLASLEIKRRKNDNTLSRNAVYKIFMEEGLDERFKYPWPTQKAFEKALARAEYKLGIRRNQSRSGRAVGGTIGGSSARRGRTGQYIMKRTDDEDKYGQE